MDELDLLDPGVTKQNEGGGGGEASLPHANAVLTLGILSIVGCFLYGLPGLICGIIALALYPKDKRLYESDPRRYGNSYKNSKAGMICAVIGTSLSAIYFIVAIFMFISLFSRFPY